MNFRSDNEAPVAPAIIDALLRANHGSAHSYGADEITARLQDRFAALFETPCAVYPVATGTAANALSIAELSPPYGAVFCHAESHLHTDECGAAEFYTAGAKLMPVAGAHGRIDADRLEALLAGMGRHGEHEPAPAVLSLTQATEAGTVYDLDSLAQLSAIARRHGLAVHMDGARFANAIAALGCAPADATWRLGVAMLSFGATKNGCLAAEAVVDFRPPEARPPHASLGRRRMKGGHLLSKMRFLSAQLEAYVTDGLWLALAARANAGAARIAAGVAASPAADLVHPVEANEVFVRAAPETVAALAADGFAFHRWSDETIRLVVPHDFEDGHIERLLARLAGADEDPSG